MGWEENGEVQIQQQQKNCWDYLASTTVLRLDAKCVSARRLSGDDSHMKPEKNQYYASGQAC